MYRGIGALARINKNIDTQCLINYMNALLLGAVKYGKVVVIIM